MRAGRAQLAESYIVIRKTEVFLIGAHFLLYNLPQHMYDPTQQGQGNYFKST